MRSIEEVIKQSNLKIMVVGNSGSGKTHFTGTFPKSYVINTEPGGMDTIANNPQLSKNIVGWDEFIPDSPKDTKRVFQELQLACDKVKELAREGKVETLVLDNMTYLSENRWTYIETHEPKFSTRTGDLDKMSMFGALGRWQYQFVLMNLLRFPGNVVMTVHEQLESDEALDKKPDKSCPILPNIIGGFRDKAEGMFSCVMYLQKIKGQQGYKHVARTNKGNQRNAKNRYNLPEIIENPSYSNILTAIRKNVSQVKEK